MNKGRKEKWRKAGATEGMQKRNSLSGITKRRVNLPEKIGGQDVMPKRGKGHAEPNIGRGRSTFKEKWGREGGKEGGRVGGRSGSSPEGVVGCKPRMEKKRGNYDMDRGEARVGAQSEKRGLVSGQKKGGWSRE